MSLHPRRRWCDTALLRLQPKGFKPSCLFMRMIGWQLHDISANWKMVQKGQKPYLLLSMQWKVSYSPGWVDKFAVCLVIVTCPMGQWSLLGNSISNYRKTVTNPAQPKFFFRLVKMILGVVHAGQAVKLTFFALWQSWQKRKRQLYA